MTFEAKGTWAMAGALAAAVSAAAGDKPKSTTVNVDCSKGQSINAALQTAADELVVEIRGVCNEDVVVRRGNVTLHGADPANDGIRGVATVPPDPVPPIGFYGAALAIIDGDAVEVQNLTISNGALQGAAIHESNPTEFRNCRFTGNPDAGLHISSASFVRVIDSIASGNGAVGARVQRGASGNFTNCVLKDNPTPGAGTGLAAVNNGLAFAESCEIGGQRGMNANGGARADAFASTISGTLFAVNVSENANAIIADSTISGPIRAANQSKVSLFGATQTANSGSGNRTFAGGIIYADTGDTGPSSLIGPTTASAFSQVILFDVTHAGNLACDGGGDAICSDPNAITGTVTGCPHCVKP